MTLDLVIVVNHFGKEHHQNVNNELGCIQGNTHHTHVEKKVKNNKGKRCLQTVAFIANGSWSDCKNVWHHEFCYTDYVSVQKNWLTLCQEGLKTFTKMMSQT